MKAIIPKKFSGIQFPKSTTYQRKLYFYHLLFTLFTAVYYYPPPKEEDAALNKRRRRSTDNKIDVSKVDEEFCVVIKPPPPTPAPTLGPGVFMDIEPVITNSSTNYTLSVTKSKCLFWNAVNETWSSNGCVVSSWFLYFWIAEHF